MSGRFDGKVLLATGGGSGLAAAVARRFTRDGGRVALLDMRGEAARAVASDLPGAIGIEVDVASEEGMRDAVAQVHRQFGRIDCAFCAAGHADFDPIEKWTLERWNRMMAVHLGGTFLVVKNVLPLMRAQGGGSIVNVASIAAITAQPNNSVYGAAKAGIIGFTKSLAYEVAQEGITANCINPGATQTPLLRSIPDDWLARKKAEIPMGRFGRVEEIAPAALLLASDEGAYFLGASLNINGGDYMI